LQRSPGKFGRTWAVEKTQKSPQETDPAANRVVGKHWGARVRNLVEVGRNHKCLKRDLKGEENALQKVFPQG